MSELEREQMLEIIKVYTKRFKNNKIESSKFLNTLGMLTPTGKLKKIYRG